MRKTNELDQADLCRIVSRWVDKFPSEAEAARSISITPQTLNAQRNAIKSFSDRVLKAAGLRRVVTTHFEFIEGPRS